MFNDYEKPGDEALNLSDDLRTSNHYDPSTTHEFSSYLFDQDYDVTALGKTAPAVCYLRQLNPLSLRRLFFNLAIFNSRFICRDWRLEDSHLLRIMHSKRGGLTSFVVDDVNEFICFREKIGRLAKWMGLDGFGWLYDI